MSAANYNFSIEQGTSFKISLVYKDENGTIVDLTGWCARLTWKTNTNVTQVFTTENTDFSAYKFFITGPEGKIDLLLPASTTNELNFSSAKYDLELQANYNHYSPDGGKYITRLLYGDISIIKRHSKSDVVLECSP